MALRYFRQTAAIDLADTHAAIDGGVHIAALGGIWMLAVFGFAGLSLQSDTSYVDRSYTGYDDYSQLLPAFLGDKSLDPALASFNSYDQNVVWTKAWQQEFRLSSQDSASRFNWVVGAYYRHALDGVQQFIAPDLSPLTEVLFGANSLDTFGNQDFVTGGLAVASYSRFTTVTTSDKGGRAFHS